MEQYGFRDRCASLILASGPGRVVVKLSGLIFIGLVVLGSVLALQTFLGGSVDPNTPVRVLTSDPIQIVLPVSPDRNTILAQLSGELHAAADRTGDPVLSRELDRLADDTDYLGDVAERSVADFDSGDVAALAFALYDVDVQEHIVLLTAITLEIVPQIGTVGISIDHENGHAYINTELAQRCGATLVRDAAARGQRSRTLELTVRNELLRIGDEAHARYHGYVNGTRPAQHLPWARKATEETLVAGC